MTTGELTMWAFALDNSYARLSDAMQALEK